MFLFAKIVEHGGYSAAARVIGMPTSKLSRHITELEQRLGVRLLNRTTRKISTTDIGKTFYAHCVALVAEADAAREAIEKTRAAPCGTIRVSCPPGLLHNQLSAIMTGFLRENPLVRLHLEATNRRVDVVEEGIDVAIRVRSTPPESSELVVRPLANARLVLLGSPALLDLFGRPTSVFELARFETLAMSSSTERQVWSFAMNKKTDVASEGNSEGDSESASAADRPLSAFATRPTSVVAPDAKPGTNTKPGTSTKRPPVVPSSPSSMTTASSASVVSHTHVPRLATDDFTFLYQAAVAGLGITYLPEYMADAAISAGVLEHVLPELSLPQGTVQAVFSSRKGMVPAVRVFIDALVAGFSDETKNY